MTADGYLTTAEAAEILGQSQRTIRRKAERGQIPVAVKTHERGLYLFSRQVIELLATAAAQR